MKSNIIGVGLIRIPNYTQRALLFKALADVVGIPATLCRSPAGKFYNEVYVTVETTTQNKTPHNGTVICGILDLLKNVGCIYAHGTEEARMYCNMWPL